MTSPSPDKPDKVKGLAPIAIAKADISVNPRVIKAALALSPYPSPSIIPAPKAITFFNAPPNSTPITS
jgi:hypothetical protein